MNIKTMDVSLVQKCFLAGANAIDTKKEIINDLNVFPVPDGDTGTNMTMTIMSAAKEVAALNNPEPQPCDSAVGLVRYMAHLDQPEKYQYDRDSIIGHGGFDVQEILEMRSGEEMVKSERHLIVDHGLAGFHHYPLDRSDELSLI